MRITTELFGKETVLSNYAEIDLPDATIQHLSEFCGIVSGKRFDTSPQHFSGITKTLNCDQNFWPVLCNSKARNSHINSCVESFFNSVSSKEESDYFKFWLSNRKFLDSLQLASFDPSSWRKFSGSQSHFEVDDEGHLPKTHYITDGTSTGRLTVRGGPNFLTLPKEFRQSLIPSSDKNRILNVDFTSLEPHVAMWYMKIPKGSGDIYENISSLCGLHDRATGKLATLSALYGASHSKLAAQVGDKKRAKSLIDKVRSFLEVEKLEKMLNQQATKGIVRNAFGRPLREAVDNERLRVNHFLQSTAAEISVAMFSKLCEKFPRVKPLIVIHDALLIEVPDRIVNSFLAESASIVWDDFCFPTKSEFVGNDFADI